MAPVGPPLRLPALAPPKAVSPEPSHLSVGVEPLIALVKE